MKKQKMKDVSICDKCQKEVDWASSCMKCGKDFCYECRKAGCAEYPHGVHFSGSGDGLYCNPCDQTLRADGTDKRHSAYLKIQALRKEEARFYEDFKRRADAAAEEIRSMEAQA